MEEALSVLAEKGGDRAVVGGGLNQDQPGLADPEADEIDPSAGQALAGQRLYPEDSPIPVLRLVQITNDDVDVMNSAGSEGAHLGRPLRAAEGCDDIGKVDHVAILAVDVDEVGGVLLG